MALFGAVLSSKVKEICRKLLSHSARIFGDLEAGAGLLSLFWPSFGQLGTSSFWKVVLASFSGPLRVVKRGALQAFTRTGKSARVTKDSPPFTPPGPAQQIPHSSLSQLFLSPLFGDEICRGLDLALEAIWAS